MYHLSLHIALFSREIEEILLHVVQQRGRSNGYKLRYLLFPDYRWLREAYLPVPLWGLPFLVFPLCFLRVRSST